MTVIISKEIIEAFGGKDLYEETLQMVEEIVGEYWGPQGTVAVMAYDDFPKDTFVFLKEGKVVDIRNRFLLDKLGMPEMGTYDGLMCRTDEGPDAVMGKEWCDETEAKAKKRWQ